MPPPDLVPVLLCGGSGTRLWPVSRSTFPKQFARFSGARSLFQETCLRVGDLAGDRWVVVTNEDHRFLVTGQGREVGRSDLRLILEPRARNTAPAIAAAAVDLLETHGDRQMLVLPADHGVRQPQALRAAVPRGGEAAEEGALVTFGVVPDRPETGFGYIRSSASGDGPRVIEEFVEKPDAQTAEAYLRGGAHLWNSGMFLFRASRFLEELEASRPDMRGLVERAWREGRDDDGGVRHLAAGPFGEVRGDSIDYAVMEHTSRGRVVPLDAGWDDAGSWDAVRRLASPDDDGNVVEGDVALVGTRGSYVRSDDRLVACVGVDDLVVVETDDAVLVSRRDRSGELKVLVEGLRAEGRPEVESHTTVVRPWGAYRVLDGGDGFQVKRITVNPGGCLSLQYHYHRAEQWVVVRGTATVTRDDEVLELGVGRSVEIPLGVVHRLENRHDDPMEIIEVQTGSYLGEDDIVRLEDRYGREDPPSSE
ncbi:MAG: mannose-1-phosphate guanylyltransferase/mannose-6-phosphate isomerase [Longimicrobiales bacterium]